MRHEMVELEECRGAASAPVVADEGTTAAVPSRHGASHRRGNLARASGGIVGRARLIRPQWATGRLGELLALEIREQRGQGAIEDLARIAIRYGVTQQILGPPEPVMRSGAAREPELVTVGRERHDRIAWRIGTASARDRKRRGRGPLGATTTHPECHSLGTRVGAAATVRQASDRSCGAGISPIIGSIPPARFQQRARCRRQLGRGCRRSGGRQFPNQCSHVRLREPPGQRLLQLPLALPRGEGEQLALALRRQVGCDEPQRREVELPLGQPVQRARKPLRRACRDDAVVGSAFRKVQHPGAVHEQRLEACAEMESPRVELGEVGDQRCGRLPLRSRQPRYLGDEFGIR
jgi:hypothetical protein